MSFFVFCFYRNHETRGEKRENEKRVRNRIRNHFETLRGGRNIGEGEVSFGKEGGSTRSHSPLAIAVLISRPSTESIEVE